jgi:MFS transporter, DHA1 family, multidrug resistance protein
MARDDSVSNLNPHPGVGPREFVGLVAAMMSIGALGTDMMLPALPAIGRSLDVGNANSLQWIIAAYSFGFGGAQLIYGPLVDRYGRKPVLRVAFIGFVTASILAAAATSFEWLIAARILQGAFASANRVLVTAIVRDCYSGRQMSRVMSLAQMIFFVAPILAPSLGALLLEFGPWRWNFWALALLGLAILFWTNIRLPETLNPVDRRAIDWATLAEAYRATLRNRFSLGYTLAQALCFGALLGYVNTSEQIIAGTFAASDRFPLVFAAIALAMGISTFANASLVERFGTRKLSHGALLAVIAVALVHLLVSVAGLETLASFIVLQGLELACFGLIGANFSAMAMQPLGHLAGTASSVQGFISGVGGAAIGIVIGQSFDGTTIPIAAGFVLAGIGALAIVLVTEGGRLFVAREAEPLRPQ